jgi:uncharacterized membrane protein YhaH (DUF805 family)
MEQAQSAVKQNVWWLIKHAWNILFKHNSWNERISKGENLAAGLILWIVSAIAMLLAALVWWWSTVSIVLVVIIYIAMLYFVLKLMKQRFNDLGIWQKWMRWTIAGGIGWGLLFLLAGAITTKSIVWWVIIGIIAAIILWFVLWHNLLSQYETGSEGDNRYGSDPLPRQPRSNRAYIVLGLMPVLLWLWLILSGVGGWLLMSKFWINPSMLWWSIMMSGDNMMDQIDIDTTQPVGQQIDTAIQAEDTSAIAETITTN